MDFIKLNFNPKAREKENIDIKYGSGLDKSVPSKSPLERKFKFPLLGDISENPETSVNYGNLGYNVMNK